MPDDTDRARVESYIQNVFRKHYQADVRDFHPLLMTIENGSGEIISALGLRFAHEQKLVAEAYARQDIGQLFNEKLHINAHREHMIEIGNLASSHSGHAKFLFVAMTRVLSDWHFRWITFTAVPAVINVFRKLQLKPVEVCPAQLKDLTNTRSDWGAYYQHQPRVMLGDIASAHSFLEQQGSYQRLDFQWL